jgi:hypothetical protein
VASHVVRPIACSFSSPSIRRPSTRRGRGRSVRQISTDGRTPGAANRIVAGAPSRRGSSSGAGRLSRWGPDREHPRRRRRRVEDDVARQHDGAALAAQHGPRAVGAVADAAAPVVAAVPAQAQRLAGAQLAVGDELRTTSPAASTTSTSTTSRRLSSNRNVARSKRPSWLGLKNGKTFTSWTSGGVLFRRWATKNAPNVATTSAAKATRAKVVTGG